jgi:hypothetical protein
MKLLDLYELCMVWPSLPSSRENNVFASASAADFRVSTQHVPFQYKATYTSGDRALNFDNDSIISSTCFVLEISSEGIVGSGFCI